MFTATMQHTFIFIFVSSFSLIHSYLSFHVLSFFFFSSSSHSFPTFLLSSSYPLLFLHLFFILYPLFLHFLIFIPPLPVFHLSPIPHSCINQSHWRFCGDFCDYSDCDLLYFYRVCIVFYCIYCIPIFQHQVCK